MHAILSRTNQILHTAGVAAWSASACLLAAALLIAPACSISHAEKPADSGKPHPTAQPGGEKRITPAEAKKLFALVDELMKFASDETGLPIKAQVKRQLTSREAVEKYMKAKLNEDKSEQRMERDEIVLKKFGLLDRDFDLGPFMLALLKEQIAGYYDDKTKTVNLLDWLDVDLQKPVMAHELTHALQDQHVGLEAWGEQTPDDVSTNAAGDATHLTRDEWDTAREAVAEGQATAVMTDYLLKPAGKSLIANPEMVEAMLEQMNGAGEDSPVMARAPLLLSESMLFPYREGLSFEQDIWMDQGQKAAFAGALDQPPNSSWEILNPREYEQHHMAPVPLLPNIHPLVDPLYTAYDIGQIGQLDLHILAQILGGEVQTSRLTPAWNGGIYWAGQLKSATTAAARAQTASLAILYLSVWRNQASAENFAQLYGQNLDRKYSHVEMEKSNGNEREDRQIYSTSEGPVVITRRGAMVFVAESFPRALALQLTDLVLDAQGTGATQFAAQPTPTTALPGLSPTLPTLSGNLVRVFAHSGVLKAVVQAEARMNATR
jgi:hypothetical protein